MKIPAFRFDFKTRHAGIASLITIAVLTGTVILNILAGEIDLKADLTSKKLYSLSDETQTLLETLNRPVEILALYEPGKEPETIMTIVNDYGRRSGMVTVRTVDPDREPGTVSRFAGEANTIERGSIIVASGSYFRIVSGMELYDISYNQQGQPQVLGQKVEQQITSAIAYVSSGRTPKIVEIIGHRETPLAEIGYAAMLQQANYIIDQVNLVLDDIPADTALLTLIGPRTDLSEAETGKIDAYLKKGGRLFTALDLSQEPPENLYRLLRRWDIEVIHGLVMEFLAGRLIAEFGDNPFVFAPFMTDHEALNALDEARMDPVFQASLGFRRTGAEQRQLEFFTLLSSSDESRLRTDLTSEASMSTSAIPSDVRGPVDVAVAVRQRNMDTYRPEGAIIVALGSASTLGGLGYLGQIKANADLVLNLVNWTMSGESVVNVASKSLFRLPLNISTPLALIYTAIVVVLLPLTALTTGIVVYFRRRNR